MVLSTTFLEVPMRPISRRTFLSTAATAAAISSTSCTGSQQVEAPSIPLPSSAEQFVGKFVEDMGAAARACLGYIGDRLGMFKAMAGAGPVTVEELTRRTGLHARYVRAWLETMVAAEYIEIPTCRQDVPAPAGTRCCARRRGISAVHGCDACGSDASRAGDTKG